MKTKKCSKCGKLKSISEFCKDKSRPDGLHFYCKICVIGYTKKYYISNKKRILEYNKKWTKNNPQKIKVIHKRYRENNKDKTKERNHKNYLKICRAKEFLEKYGHIYGY